MKQRFHSEIKIRTVREQADGLQIIATKRGLTLSDIVRMAISEYLRRPENQEMLREPA